MTNDLWTHALSLLEKKVNPQIFATWIRPLRYIGADQETLRLGAPNKFFKDWVTDNYGDLIRDAVREAGGRSRALDWSVFEDGPAPAETAVSALPAELPPGTQRESNLNPRYTFESFVVGSSNQFAHAASVAVAESPGKNYNPLFIYGGVGLGKTHLLTAIGHQIRKKHPQLKIIYASSEKFMNELINALRYEKMADFRSKYRDHCDVLLIDDIQFMSNKIKTQEEFFYTFNTLFENHRQIVMTSDRFPREIPAIEERLRSRLEWGLIADIQPPEIETRTAILKKKAEEDGIQLPHDVAMYIAGRVRSNVRELEGALIRISAFASLNGVDISLSLAKEVLRDLLPENNQIISIELIQKTVASFYNVKPNDLRSPKRVRSLAFPRQVAMYLCRKLTNASFPEIGEKFGGKDHSTVIHAVKKVEIELEKDPLLRSTLQNIEQSLGVS